MMAVDATESEHRAAVVLDAPVVEVVRIVLHEAYMMSTDQVREFAVRRSAVGTEHTAAGNATVERPNDGGSRLQCRPTSRTALNS